MSVVINTYNRADSLETTLLALPHQTFGDFEVIVVNGPSTDATRELLNSWGERIRVEDCPERSLGKSRNIGIQAAAGDVVAFIDDDAIPEPDWLETLLGAYGDPRVAGAGGLVFDRAGSDLQYRFSACDRIGNTRFDVEPPFHEYLRPGADPFLYLQGTNCSFRRSCLVEVGGFDEEIEFMYDEVEVCLRLIDAGYLLAALDGAAVHHKYRASHLRKQSGIVVNPYPAVKNRARLAFRYGSGSVGRASVRSSLEYHIDALKSAVSASLAKGWVTVEERNSMVDEIDRGFADGIEAGLKQSRMIATFDERNPAHFRLFPTIVPSGQRLRVAYVSGEYPPGYFGGIGRFTQDLSVGLAEAGHEVHVVTPSDEQGLDLEEGVWVHRLKVQDRWIDGIEESGAKSNWLHLAAYYHEIAKLHGRRPLDIVSGPLWNSEPLICSLDDRFPTVTTLMSSLATVVKIHPSWSGSPHVEPQLRLERLMARTSQHLHAISQAILDDVNEQYGPLRGHAEVVPLGVRYRSFDTPAEDGGERVRLLFVGRLERRKGVDLLLDVLPTLLHEHPELEVHIVGQDTLNTEIGEGYRERFLRQQAGRTEILDRVSFAGQVTEQELYRAYAECDLFCAPSRYESLGLVLLEAMMMGKPVVASAVGGMREIVRDNGLLVEAESADALAAGLRALISDADRRSVMGNRSRELFESFWSLPHAVERTAAFYQSIRERVVLPPVGSEEQQTVVGRLTTLLTDVEGLGDDEALKTARALLDGSCYPVDYRSLLRRLWQSPDHAFVDGLYQLLLGREPDIAGRERYLSLLRTGRERAEVLRMISGSLEVTLTGIDGGLIDEAFNWPTAPAPVKDYPSLLKEIWHLPDREFVRELYRVVLERDPDSPGLEGHVTALAQGSKRGAVVRSFVSSPEAQNRRLDSSWLSEIESWEGRLESSGSTDSRDDSAGLLDSGLAPDTTGKAMGRVAINRMIGLARRLAQRAGARPQDREASPSPEDRMSELSDALGRFEQILSDVRSRQEELGNLVGVLQVKLEAMAMDVREKVPASAVEDEIADPLIPDEVSFRSLVEQMDGSIRINLGRGEKPLPGYVNIDARQLPGVDVVADVRRLPFEPGSLAEIASAHLVEHFRTHHFSTVILPYWISLLREGGILRVVCPNGEELVKRAADGQLSMEDFRTVMFGLQDYSGDDHLAMYTPDMLRSLLESAGFTKVELIEEARQNGLCPEMEVVASVLSS